MAIAITLKADARADKYGIVVVKNDDGTFNRSYRITGQELADLQASGNGVPPGVTRKEWESGLATVVGKGMDVADAIEDTDKQGRAVYRIKVAEKIDAQTGQYTEDFLIVPVADAAGVFPAISVAPEKVSAGLVSVTDGVVVIADGVLTKG